jgi:hypothetical protein
MGMGIDMGIDIGMGMNGSMGGGGGVPMGGRNGMVYMKEDGTYVTYGSPYDGQQGQLMPMPHMGMGMSMGMGMPMPPMGPGVNMVWNPATGSWAGVGDPLPQQYPYGGGQQQQQQQQYQMHYHHQQQHQQQQQFHHQGQQQGQGQIPPNDSAKSNSHISLTSLHIGATIKQQGQQQGQRQQQGQQQQQGQASGARQGQEQGQLEHPSQQQQQQQQMPPARFPPTQSQALPSPDAFGGIGGPLDTLPEDELNASIFDDGLYDSEYNYYIDSFVLPTSTGGAGLGGGGGSVGGGGGGKGEGSGAQGKVSNSKRSFSSTLGEAVTEGHGGESTCVGESQPHVGRKPNAKAETDKYYRSAVDIDLAVNPQLSISLELSLAEGSMNIKEEEYMSARRRRRLNQIVPNPRKSRTADYTCSLCSEPYQVVVPENPWWAVYTHECPKCKQKQIPRIDINAPANAVELDPNVVALYGEGVEDSDDEGVDFSDEDEDEDEEGASQAQSVIAAQEGDGDRTSLENLEPTWDGVVAAAGGGGGGGGGGGDAVKVEEDQPFDGEGLLAKEEASKLLVLMCHARSCTGSHSSDKHAEICKSTKYLMLHIRDCRGTDLHGRDCLFPWCRPCRKMLRHLTQCYVPDTCNVCNPW